jgi:hypothetical protein
MDADIVLHHGDTQARGNTKIARDRVIWWSESLPANSYPRFDFGLVALFLFPAWVLLLDMPAPL